MTGNSIAKKNQEQAIATWVDQLNKLRFDELLKNLTNQGINLKNALTELQKLRDFVNSPENILGSLETKHGEVAEHMQVNISNARRLVEGLKPEHTFDGVGRTAPEDYLYNGNPIQAKFYNSEYKTFQAIKDHLEKYPDFIKNGGSYDIPKDQYDKIIKIIDLPEKELRRGEYTLLKKIREWERENNNSFLDTVHPSDVKHSETQLNVADKTIDNREKEVRKANSQKKDKAYNMAKPTIKQGTQVAMIAGVAEGGMNFCLGVIEIMKTGKKLPDFTYDDWEKLGISSARAAGKGTVRGASVYVLTNFTQTTGAVASSFVTACFGVISQAQLFRQGDISQESFIINSEVMCLEVTISAIASMIGQAVIPIPVLGAVIGNTVGMFMYGIAKNYLYENELKCIEAYALEIKEHHKMLDDQSETIIVGIENEFNKYISLTELAFDYNVNVAFDSSIELAKLSGVDDNLILKTPKEVDDYFVN